MLTNRERLDRQKARPLLVDLHRKLSRLGSTLVVMNTGAHPDDEQSEMLAAMRFGRGMHVVVLCSTRGEGGQNALGPERTGALGVLRTRELEEAAKALDADIAWVGHGPDDPVHDFGFSKSGTGTLAIWGREQVIERMVRAYRTYRPDIVIPTFLDVPGQHGHHRAMTEVAEAAIALAADPHAYPEHLANGLMPWRVAKYYLPAWSGGGDTYDDEVPPPNATVTFAVPGRDPATGASWTDLGEWSRAGHASQGMGVWRPDGDDSWPLHLKFGPDGVETDISDRLPGTLADLARLVAPAARDALLAADAEITRARAAFPDRAAIIAALGAAASSVETALGALDAASRSDHGHRLERKRAEIDEALFAAAEIRASAWVEPTPLTPGGTGRLKVWHEDRGAVVTVTPVVNASLSAVPAGADGGTDIFELTVAADAPIANAYPPGFSALSGNGPVFVSLEARIGHRIARMRLDLEETAQIAPAQSVRLDPDAIIIALGNVPETLAVAARTDGSAGNLDLSGAPGISVERTPEGFGLRPGALAPGLHRLSARIDGRQAYRITPIAYPHVGRLRYLQPEEVRLLALDLKLPEGARIGYVGGGSDRVGLWLRRMGLDVTDLMADDFGSGLDAFTTIVVGTFGYGARPDLLSARDRINDWVERGGHLVTLYHRPKDGWDPGKTPPRRLVIGSPSLRWRVTDPDAAVTVLAPGHVLLNGPNTIGPEDFAGWDKERGLYFAADWDPAYQPLLSMHDAGEAPLSGALLSARIGTGRHTHVSLVLHHQLDKLVPGAFRLMANLVQRA